MMSCFKIVVVEFKILANNSKKMNPGMAKLFCMQAKIWIKISYWTQIPTKYIVSCIV